MNNLNTHEPLNGVTAESVKAANENMDAVCSGCGKQWYIAKTVKMSSCCNKPWKPTPQNDTQGAIEIMLGDYEHRLCGPCIAEYGPCGGLCGMHEIKKNARAELALKDVLIETARLEWEPMVQQLAANQKRLDIAQEMVDQRDAEIDTLKTHREMHLKGVTEVSAELASLREMVRDAVVLLDEAQHGSDRSENEMDVIVDRFINEVNAALAKENDNADK
jgi:hypothetical protein